jgi:hypothetical protein
VQTAFEHDRTHLPRKSLPAIAAECHNVLPVVALKMRKLSTDRNLRRRFLWGDRSSRRSTERSSAVVEVDWEL